MASEGGQPKGDGDDTADPLHGSSSGLKVRAHSPKPAIAPPPAPKMPLGAPRPAAPMARSLDRPTPPGATVRPPGLADKRMSPTPPAPTHSTQPTDPPQSDPPDHTQDVEIDMSIAISRDSFRPPSHDSFAPPADKGLLTFGRYEILGRLATGGMAEIFLAREQTAMGGAREVVVKLARPHFDDLGEFHEMFINEGRVQLLLTHPNICHVYELGKENGRYFMAMEYVNGVSLRQLVVRARKAGEKVPATLVLRVAAQVAEALDFAHRARDTRGRPLQIVHRDVSPHNVMVSYDGVVKLLDFGVASGRGTKSTTQSGTVKGKFNYMSPQQCTGGVVDARADIFALGVCIWEALTGKLLFKRETQYETFRAIIESPAPPVARERDDVPPEVDAILAKALAKSLEDRYHTAGELQDDLEKVLAKQSELMNASRVARYVREHFAEELARGPVLDTSAEVMGRLAPPAVSTAGRRSGLLVPIVAGTIGVAAGLALILVLGGRDPEPTPAPTPDPAPESARTETTTGEEEAAPPTEGQMEVLEVGEGPPAAEGPAAEPGSAEEPAEETDDGDDDPDRRHTKRRRTHASMTKRVPGLVSDPGF